MLHYSLSVRDLYEVIMRILGLKSRKYNNLLCMLNNNLKNNSWITYDNRNMIRVDDFTVMTKNKDLEILFHPLNQQEKSCNRLVVIDSIHMYMQKLVYRVFTDIIASKEGAKVTSKFNSDELDNLGEITKNTKYKFYNIFNIANATSFSKNLISFEIDFINSKKEAKVNFEFLLFDALNTMRNNKLFGIHLENFEIMFFKKVYDNYIIKPVNEIFKNYIEIPEKSSTYPEFYTLMKIKLMLEETYWQNHNICFINCKKMISKYNAMLADLNQYKEYLNIENCYSKVDLEIDQEAYQNELQRRKACEPDWFLLKDGVMKDKNELITQEEFNKRFNRQYWNTYIQKISTLQANSDIKLYIANKERMNNQAELAEILDMQRFVLNIINGQDGRLWFDTRTKKYSFRSEYNGEITEHDKKEITAILNIAMQRNLPNYYANLTDFSNYVIEVVLVESIDDIAKNKLKDEYNRNQIIKILLFTKAIPTINGDTFNLEFTEEIFQSDTDLLFKRNRFVPNQYLIKRDQQNQLIAIGSIKQTFIEKFIYNLVKEDETLYKYIINWLAYYFQNLKKTKTALVLIGEEEIAKNIFWNLIIKEIFGKRYCITINDKECDTTLVSDIAKDKLFFRIDDIVDADTKFDDETLALIIKDLLIKPSVTADTNEEIYIHGQILITAKNPAPYLKKVLSKCTVIEINNIDTIMEKLDVADEGELEDVIGNDLDNFADRLANYKIISENAERRIDTKDRETLINNKSSNTNKEDIDRQIDAFIQAIKDKDLDYFERVKEIDHGKIYEHLEIAFNQDDGYFIGQDMYLYYNAINEPHFNTNKSLMNKLKAKDEMFRQEVKTLKIIKKNGGEEVLFQSYKTSTETENKELYKINDYTLAKDIIIPSGATIVSSQTAYRKYTFENEEEMDNCIARTKEYREKKS